MFDMITRQQIRKLNQGLESGESSEESRLLEELKGFFKIKERLFGLAPNVGGCCGVYSFSGELFRQVELLEWALQALEQGDRESAVNILEWLEENCILPENEEEVKKLKAELGESPETDETERLLKLEQLLYEKSEQVLPPGGATE